MIHSKVEHHFLTANFRIFMIAGPGFLIRIFIQHWLKSYMPTVPQSTMMDQSYSISIEGLNHVVPKWSNRSSKVGHLVFSLGQWCAIVAYQIS